MLPVSHGRRLAHVIDAPKEKGATPDKTAKARLSAKPTPPARASNRDLVPAILDQGRLGSCTANAVAYAVRGAMLAVLGALGLGSLGFLPPFIARLLAYYLARAYDHDTENDDGAQIRNVFAGILKYGFVPEDLVPYSDDGSPGAPFSRAPTQDVIRAAADRRFGGSYERIDSTGDARIDDIKRAIAARHLVVFGTVVSDAFCSGALGGQPLAPPKEADVAGRHALTIAEYDTDGAGKVVFGVPNSWGYGWGAQGWCRMSAEYIKDARSVDFWIVQAAPLFDRQEAANA